MNKPNSPAKNVVVVIVISNMEYGGAQRQVAYLANHINEEQFDLHVVSLSDYVPMAPLIRGNDTNFHIIQKGSKYDMTVIPRLARLLRTLHADIVHGYLFDAEIAARLAGVMARTPVIGNCERNTNYEFKKVHLLAYGLTRPCLDLYIANSNAGAHFNQEYLKNRKDMYYTVHNGVDDQRFCPQESAPIRKDLNLRPEHFVVGMFGSLKEQKNHMMLFQAAHSLKEKHANLRLLLVGDQLAGGMHGSSEYSEGVRQAVRDMGLEEICVFTGNQDNVERLYSACDVTALPSLFEGTPNVALESMSCSVPVVATNVSDNAYIIRDEETGYLVDLHDVTHFADCIDRLARDPRLRRRLGKQAREFMQKEFSCERLAQKTEQVYLNSLGLDAPTAEQLRSF
jgi:glycosyltransferase involved in cell wall biosynthesis